MGDEAALSSKRLASREVPDLELDRAMSPEARLENGIRFNRFGSEMALAGAKARARHAHAA
jgi:hypothetical protein